MLRRLILTLTVLGGLSAGLLAPLPGAVAVAATNPYKGVDCGAAAGSAVCKDNSGQDPLTGSNGVLVTATNILAFVAGATAVIFMVVGGIKYITAAGAPAEVQKAKETIIYALVGVIVIIISRQVISYVLSRV